jgi:hypothetical protein
VFLSGSEDELCGQLLALLQAVAYHLLAFPAIHLLIVHAEISSLPLSPSLMHLQCSHHFCCVLVFSSLFIVHFFFFLQEGQSTQGAMLVYPRGGWGNTM